MFVVLIFRANTYIHLYADNSPSNRIGVKISFVTQLYIYFHASGSNFKIRKLALALNLNYICFALLSTRMQIKEAIY